MGKLPPLETVIGLSVMFAVSVALVFAVLIVALWAMMEYDFITDYNSLLGYALVSSCFASAMLLYLSFTITNQPPHLILNVGYEKEDVSEEVSENSEEVSEKTSD